MPSVQSIPDNVVVSYYLAAQADRHLSTPDGMTLKLLHQLYSAGNAMARFHAEHCPRYQAWQFSSCGVSWHTFGWLYHHVFQRSGAVADRVYNYMKRHISQEPIPFQGMGAAYRLAQRKFLTTKLLRKQQRERLQACTSALLTRTASSHA